MAAGGARRDGGERRRMLKVELVPVSGRAEIDSLAPTEASL
jgi:hypothetical protein